MSTKLESPVCWSRQGLRMLWTKSRDSLLETTSVPHPNFTRCMAGGQPRHSTSCCRREGGRFILWKQLPHSLSWLSKANTNTRGLSQPSWRASTAPSHLHCDLQTSSSFCKTKGKEREPEKGQSLTPGAFALSFLLSLCHPCPLGGPE